VRHILRILMMEVIIRKEIETEFSDVYELNEAAFGQ
jgi:hypothetical protein